MVSAGGCPIAAPPITQICLLVMPTTQGLPQLGSTALADPEPSACTVLANPELSACSQALRLLSAGISVPAGVAVAVKGLFDQGGVWPCSYQLIPTKLALLMQEASKVAVDTSSPGDFCAWR